MPLPRLITEKNFDSVEKGLIEVWCNSSEVRDELVRSNVLNKDDASRFICSLILSTFEELQRRKRVIFDKLKKTLLVRDESLDLWMEYLERLMRHALEGFDTNMLMSEESLENVMRGSLSFLPPEREINRNDILNISEALNFIKSLFSKLWQTVWTLDDIRMDSDISHTDLFLPPGMLILPKLDRETKEELSELELKHVLAPAIVDTSANFVFKGCGSFARKAPLQPDHDSQSPSFDADAE